MRSESNPQEAEARSSEFGDGDLWLPRNTSRYLWDAYAGSRESHRVQRKPPEHPRVSLHTRQIYTSGTLHDRPHRDGLRRLLHGLVAVVARVEVGEHAHGGVARDLRVGPLVLDGSDVGVDGRVELDRPLDGVLAAQALGLRSGLADRVDERALVTCAESNFTARSC